MRFRLTAFGLHFTGSACALTLVLGGLYLGWYRWPGWYLSEVLRVVGIVALVDIVLGPTLTLIIANPRKPRRALARDVAIIVAVQLAALSYGAATLWQGRPLYYTFSADRLEIVQASDIKASEIARALQTNPTLAPHWYNLPRWVWAPLPDDPKEAMKIVNGTLFGGADVVEMPFYFRPWAQGLPELRKRLTAVTDMKDLSKIERQTAQARLPKLGVSLEQRNALMMWGAARRVLVVFDTNTLAIKAILKLS
jgi:hypothetical protein